MKNNILTLLLLLTIGAIKAQDYKLGLKGGLNIASQNNSLLSGVTKTNSTPIIGFNIGGFVEIKISEKFSAQPELLFSAQGGKLSYNEKNLFPITPPRDNYDVENTISLFYLNVPFTFNTMLILKLL